MRETVRFVGCIQSTVVSKMADGWYVAVAVETDDILVRMDSLGAVGVDLGVKALATLSNGDTIVGAKATKKFAKKLRRLNKALSRKKKGSANSKKAKTKLSKLHKKIGDARADVLHKLTHKLATQFDVIGIENLNVKGMVANRCLAKAVSDRGFFDFRTKLDYKCKMTKAEVVVVDRFFPSTRTCSECGQLHDMPLSKRTMDCECGNVMDRDVNAAINLKKMALLKIAA